jgi:hypothetical protein
MKSSSRNGGFFIEKILTFLYNPHMVENTIGDWNCGWLRGASDKSIQRAEKTSGKKGGVAKSEIKCGNAHCKIRIQTLAQGGKAFKQRILGEGLCVVYQGKPR